MNFNLLSLTRIPGRSSIRKEDKKSSKLKSSVSIVAESSDKKLSGKNDPATKKILQKNPSYQTQLTKQIIRTRSDLDKIQIDLTKLKGDLEC